MSAAGTDGSCGGARRQRRRGVSGRQGCALDLRGSGGSARQRVTEPLARADPELVEHLAQMPFDRAGADEEAGPDLRVGQSVTGEAGDLLLLRRELVARLGGALANLLARGEQLMARSIREPLRAHGREHVVRAAQLVAGVDPPVLAAQPLAIQEVRARELRTQRGAAQPIDRLEIEALGKLALAEQRP